MILHLAEDEKFIDHVIDVFEEANPNNNKYFIELQENESNLKLVKTQNKNIVADKLNSEKYCEIINNLGNFSAVILHNLYNPYKQEIIKKAPKSVHFHWMSWGADIYNYIPQLNKHLITNNFPKRNKNIFGIIGDKINLLFPDIWYNKYLKPRNLPDPNYYKNLVRKIESVSTVIPYEIDLIRRYLNKKIIYKPFKYVTIEAASLTDTSLICSENNFIVGNSAHRSSNHIDAFNKIVKIKGKEKIYVPVSYGNQNNKEKVIEAGYNIFGNSFHPIVNFLPLDEYTQVLRKCGNVVINANRQQAVGNIIIALWYGARVFLNKKKPNLQIFKRSRSNSFPDKGNKQVQPINEF